MWKTGKESLPSERPRVDRITEMKWMQVFWSSGAEEDLVRRLTSEVLMLPMTLELASRTARDVMPSVSRSLRASTSGRSPLRRRGC